MMRHMLSLMGGVVLAVGLFWLLAQLVAPPRAGARKADHEYGDDDG